MKNKHRWFTILILIIAGGFVLQSCNESLEIPDFTESNTGPYILNVRHMEFIKEHRDSLPIVSRDYDLLISGADRLLDEEFAYVTDKEKLPPSGDNHDYMSLSRYAWPNDSTGVYDDIRDGQTNPEIYDYDRPKLARFSSAVYALSLAYFYTNQEKYAEKATELIKGWFLNPSTRMKPNMKYAQVALGVNDNQGMAQGIIDANDFINVIEAISLLYNSHHWTHNDHVEMKKWFFKFTRWIIQNYNADAFESTNISTWLDVQRAVYFLFTEQKQYLNSSSHIMPVKQKIDTQLTADGALPNEKSRVRSQHYVYYNLRAYMNLALVRKNRTGQDRDWPDLASQNYAGLRPALQSLISYLNGADASQYFSESENFDNCRYLDIFKPAAIAFESEEYDMISQQLLKSGCRDPNLTLVFPKLSDIKRETIR
ncbi:MAG: alginate lyase family protein [Balneolaceae bacterium]|nr:alginate lyase family protein [Balneolaceae bacterium]